MKQHTQALAASRILRVLSAFWDKTTKKKKEKKTMTQKKLPKAKSAVDPRPRLSPTWDVRPPGFVAWGVPPQPYLLDPSAVSRSAAQLRITR